MSSLVLGLRSATLKVDRVILAILLIVGGVALVQPDQAVDGLVFAGRSLVGVSPFLIGSVMVAAYARASGADSMIAKAFTGHTATMVLVAALFGAISPFCSCGVIPVIAALLAMGVPLPAVMAFWLSSPIMDPSMFVLTSGTLGLAFALYKTFAAVAIGLFGGFGTALMLRAGWFEGPLRAGVGNGGCAGAKVRQPQAPVWHLWRIPDRRRQFATNAIKTAAFLTKWLVLAYFLESLLLTYVPAERIVSVLGGDGWLPVFLATLVGVPAYLNGYAALPLVSGLIGQGMAPGAGMTFLLAGGITSIAAAMAVFALARLPVFLSYLGFALVGSFTLGIGFNFVA